MKKKVLILIAVLLTTNFVKAQINANPNPDGPVLITGMAENGRGVFGYF